MQVPELLFQVRKLLLKVQIIDKYLGTMLMTFSFKEEKAAVRMKKRAENFLEEYVGAFVASRNELKPEASR